MTKAEQQQIIQLSQSLGWIALKKWLLKRRNHALNEVVKAALGEGGSLHQAAVVGHIDQMISFVDNMQKRVGGDEEET